MGLFLAASGIVGRDRGTVCNAIADYVESVGGTFESRNGTGGERNICIVQEGANSTTVLYPSEFTDWDELSKFLSVKLETPVFSFHIHDGDLWMLIAFDQGTEVAWFNPLPDYWGEVTEDEKTKWAGDPKSIARLVPGLKPERIANYLCRWTEENIEKGKAYPDDEFPIGTDWQLTDFMGRLGFVFPDNVNGKATGDTYYMKIRRRRSESIPTPDKQPQETAPRPQPRIDAIKPWWKFW